MHNLLKRYDFFSKITKSCFDGNAETISTKFHLISALNRGICIDIDYDIPDQDRHDQESRTLRRHKPHTTISANGGEKHASPRRVAHEFTAGLRDLFSTKDLKLCFDSEYLRHIFHQFVSSVP